MSDKEEVNISLILASHWYRLPPHVKIYLDDELIEDLSIVEKVDDNATRTVSFKRDLDEGEHTIVLEYLDKEHIDTAIDEDGVILADHLVQIVDIEIDEISLGYIVHRNGKYYPDKATRVMNKLPDYLENISCLGYNGQFKLKFQVPTYIWFLENL